MKAIVFDLDGTLAWTERYWLPVMAAVLDDLETSLGWKSSLPSVEACLDHLGKPSEEIMSAIYPTKSQSEIAAALARKEKVWDKMLSDQPFQLYPRALDTLDALQAQGWTLFVSSNCGSAYLAEMLRSTGLGERISAGACLGGYPGMAKWEFTRELLKGKEVESGYFVGDSFHDMEAGRSNGLATVFADYGYGQCHDPSLIDLHIGDIAELLDLVSEE